MSKWHFIGVAFVLIGTLYLRKPNLFRRGIWLKTSIAIRTLSPETYGKYMRGLGMLLIICGICAFIYGFFDAEPYLLRHQSGDWGDLSEIDKRENDSSAHPACRRSQVDIRHLCDLAAIGLAAVDRSPRLFRDNASWPYWHRSERLACSRYLS